MVKLTITPYQSHPQRCTATTQADERLNGWRVCLEQGGLTGLGEAYLWSGFGSTKTDIERDFKHAVLTLSSMNTVHTIIDWVAAHDHLASPVKYALELACLDLLGQQTHQTLAAILWQAPNLSVPCHRTLSTWSELNHAPQEGSQAFKIKVGKLEEADEYERLNSILSQHPTVRLRLDANGSWGLDHAQRMCALAAACPNIIIEQPLRATALEELDTLQRNTPTRIALDESFALNPEGSLSTSCQEIVIKPMYAGGLFMSQKLCERILETRKQICVTHALEGPVGRAGAQHFAAGVQTDGAHGVGDDTHSQYVTLTNALGHGVVQ